MAIIVTVKLKPRYGVRVDPVTQSGAELYDRVTGYRKAKRPHQAKYDLHDWVYVADYLNDRNAGYPVPASLLIFRSEHNEDRRNAGNRRRPARAKARHK